MPCHLDQVLEVGDNLYKISQNCLKHLKKRLRSEQTSRNATNKRVKRLK